LDFQGRDIISIKDFTKEEIDYILDIASLMEPLAKKSTNMLQGKIMATLFFEPSTRTKLSFETAMYRLGGSAIGFAGSGGTSIEKGENLADTIRTVENYADLIVMRHSLEGAARLAAEFSEIPLINAGSGAEEHPTQAMLDLYTIKKEKGTIDGLSIALVGDLRYGRTVHSLAYALSLYKVNLYLVSHELLKMRREVLEVIRKRINVKEVNNLNEILPEVDVIYMTRIQKERFADVSEYEKVKGSYRLTIDDLKNAKKDVIVMHPLPRLDEIDYRIDTTSYSKYFKQVWYGLVTRMALLALVLGAIR
jgi:aspartate carbamoyltransferase catalytic subunit